MDLQFESGCQSKSWKLQILQPSNITRWLDINLCSLYWSFVCSKFKVTRTFFKAFVVYKARTAKAHKLYLKFGSDEKLISVINFEVAVWEFKVTETLFLAQEQLNTRFPAPSNFKEWLEMVSIWTVLTADWIKEAGCTPDLI